MDNELGPPEPSSPPLRLELSSDSSEASDDQAENAGPSERVEAVVPVLSLPTSPVSHADNSKKSSHGKRVYLPVWSKTFKWIKYVPSVDKVFCSTCQLSTHSDMPLPSGCQAKGVSTFVTDGFNNWKKAVERFKTHEKTAYHRAATQNILSATNPSSPGGVSSQLDRQKKRNSWMRVQHYQ